MLPSVPGSARSARRDNDAGFCPLGEQRGWVGRVGRNRAHSVVTQGVVASYAQKLNVYAVCERAASRLIF